MSLAVIFIALVASVDATSNTSQCPECCSCQVFDTQVNVDCAQGQRCISEEKLSQQFDSMLSADNFVLNLRSLTITNTPLTRVPASVCKLVNLVSLNLNLNKLTEMPDNCFTKLKKLVTLSVRSNAIVSLQDGLFDGMQSLVTLDLSNNVIASIGLRLFSNFSDQTSLRYIDLASNHLTSLEPWPYYRLIQGNETSLVSVSLRDNWISNFTNELKFEYRCGMRPLFGWLNLDYNRIRHIMDLFNGWNIGRKSTFHTTMFCLFNNMKGHNRYADVSVATDLFGGAYVCDCTDFPIYQEVYSSPMNHMLHGVRCSNIKSKLSIYEPVRATSVPMKDFTCDVLSRCPSNCRCVYRPANATLHIYCSAGNLSSLPLELPPLPKSYDRYKLDFSNNNFLRRLEGRPYFVNTSILDVSNCSISVVDINAWRGITKMQSLFVTPRVYLQNNKIKSFPSEVIGINITSVRLTLNHNFWDCSCENRWMIGWFKTLSRTSPDVGDVGCAFPSRLKSKSIAQSTEYDFCVDSSIRILKITLLSTLTPVAVLLMFGFSAYRLRFRLYRKWKFHPFDRDECVGEDLDYDVFFSCSSMDDDPHGRRIFDQMEAKGYRVCHHQLNFLPGQLIAENMVHGVERSKRTVCLISENFIRR